MTEMGEMKKKELLVLKLVNRIGKESRAEKNGGWVKSGWMLGALEISMGPIELIKIVRSLEKDNRILIKRNRTRREDDKVFARPFECRIPPKRSRRVKRK